MKSKLWCLLVLIITSLTIISFLWLFREGHVEPRLAGVPFVFWTGFLVTVVVVVATFLASHFISQDKAERS